MEQLDRIIHNVVNAICFVTAISMFLGMLSGISIRQDFLVHDINTKSSIQKSAALQKDAGHEAEDIYITGSQVFENIKNQSDSIQIHINGTQLTKEDLVLFRENNKKMITRIYSLLSKDSNYLCVMNYDEKNALLSINYKKV